MSGQKKRSLLKLEIAAALHGTALKQRASQLFSSSVSRQILVASVALAALQPDYAAALAMGELKVRSSLGQPFSATTTARIGAGEFLSPGCVAAVAYLPGGQTNPAALNTVVEETSIPGVYPVSITSSAPMYEPMYEIQIKISCADSAALAKNYVVMLDVAMASSPAQIDTPPLIGKAAPAADIQAVAATPVISTIQRESAIKTTPIKSAPRADIQTHNTLANNLTIRDADSALSPPDDAKGSILAGREYSIRRGDTLFTIAQRVEGHADIGFRQVAEKVFQDNPSAFIDGNPDLIKMGFVINIPGRQQLGNDTSGNLSSDTPGTTTPEPGNAPLATVITAEPGNEVLQSTSSTAELLAPALSNEKSAAEPDFPAPAVAANNKVAEANPPEPPVSIEKSSGTLDTPMNSMDEALYDKLPTVAAATGAALAPITPASNIPPVADVTTPSVTTEITPAASTSAESTSATAQQSMQLDSTETIAMAASASAPTAAKPNSFLAAAMGILVGGLLAALILGRDLILAWLPGRLRRSNEKAAENLPIATEVQMDEAVPVTDYSPAEEEIPGTLAESKLPGEPDIALPKFGAAPGNTDVSPAVSIVARDEDTRAQTEGSLAESEYEAAEFDTSSQKAAPQDMPPRISPRESAPQSELIDLEPSDAEEPRENTQRYSDPSQLVAHELTESPEQVSELDGTSTMHNLFGTAAETSDNAADDLSSLDVTSTMHNIFGEFSDNAETKEIPGLVNSTENTEFTTAGIDDTSSLQTLSKSLADGHADDELSKTLTQALGLLEQDYEDELTNSQILEQKDIQKAFAEQAAKDS